MSSADTLTAPGIIARFCDGRPDYHGPGGLDVLQDEVRAVGMRVVIGEQTTDIWFAALRSITGAGERALLSIKNEHTTLTLDPARADGISELQVRPGPRMRKGALPFALLSYATKALLADPELTPARRELVQRAAAGEAADQGEQGRTFWMRYDLDEGVS